MAKAPGESKIPVLHSNQLRSRFSNISNKVRSHLDGSYRTPSPSMLFGLFSNSSSENKVHPPTRPSSLFKPTNHSSVTEKDVGSYVELTQHSKTGILRYFGKTVLGPGEWCGVEVENGHGVCDGSICGVRYFSCRDQCALFVLAHLVRVSECQSISNDKVESELMCDDGCPATMANWDLDIVKTESPFECIDSLGILTPDQMVEFRGDEANFEVPGLLFKMSPQQITECISDGDITMNDLEAISMPKDDDLVSPALSSDPSNHTVSEHDSASAYPKRSTVSFGHVFYDNFTIDRTPSLEDLPMDDLSSKTTTEVPVSNLPPVDTIVISITSIGSLDTGYQGDGETSRPTSRGATVKRIGPTEPMTDSDFFTESEAEDHCHRKARVIDGTLYSGDNTKPETQPDNQNNPGPSVEEMDSSGVYSDFDRIFEEPPIHKDSSEAISSNNSTSPSSVNSQRIHPAVIDQPITSTIPECTEDASSPASKRYKRPTPVKPKNLDLRQEQENRAPRTRKPAGRWDAVMNKIEKSKTDQKSRINRLKDVKSKINSINSLAPSYANRLKESPTNSEPLPIRSHRENTPLKAKSRRNRARGGSESNLPLSDQKPASSRPRCIPKSSQNSSRDSSFSDLSGETKNTLKPATSHPSLGNKNFNLRTPSVNVVAPSVRKPLTTSSKGSPQNRRFNSDHNLITKPDGKPTQQGPQVAKTTATTPAVAKVKAVKRDVVDREMLRHVETQLHHAAKGFDAVSVLFQYLVNDMDALSTTRLKQQLESNHNELVSTKCALDESQEKCVQYQEEIKKLQKEIDKLKNDLELKEKLVGDITSAKDTEIYRLEKKLEEQANNLRLEFNKEIDIHKNESEEEKMKLILAHDQQIVELQQTNKLEVSQLHKSVTEKQIELTQRVLVLENECDLLKTERDQLKEDNERLIENKKLHNTSLGYQKLCNEAESLRTVLELKSSEMQELRKQNEKLQSEVGDLPAILQKLEAAQSRVEDLNVQLQRKAEIEMQLSQEKDKMAREIDLEKEKKKRLSCHNEELQWKLKKSTEVANHLAVTTKRLSQTPQDLAAMREAQNNYQKLCRESSNSENSGDEDTVTSQLVVDSEAPARILGVVQKTDSLSYVFEVEEEPSEIATRLVRRASSLRSVGKSRTRTRDSIGEKRSRTNSQSSSTKSVELDSALTRNLDELFAPNTGDRYLSDCFTCSSDSSNSSPEHTAYDQNRTTSYIVTQQTGEKTTSDGLAI